jgi:hypothetical protein
MRGKRGSCEVDGTGAGGGGWVEFSFGQAIKGTVSRDFLTLYFPSNILPQVTDSHFKTFSQTAANAPKFSPFQIAKIPSES